MAERKLEQKQSSGSVLDPKGKVGSDRAADREVGGKLDFGIPAGEAVAPQPIGGRDKGPEQGTGYTRSGATGTRTDGVGHASGSPGTGSGGDLDPDLIGFDKKGGLSARPASGRTQGADITEGGSAAFASGSPAKGENELKAGMHGASPDVVRGSTVDRSGGDASTSGMGGGSDSASGQFDPADPEAERAIDDAAAGEISSGEGRAGEPA